MTPLSCLIVDDEQLARKMLEAYVNRIPDTKVVGLCRNGAEARNFLDENSVDLMFLDIELPGLLGTEFLRSLPNAPSVIFTTAYSDYAMEGFDLQAVDYLLKPIGFERFALAVDRARERRLTIEKAQAFDERAAYSQQFILIKEGHNHRKIFYKDIRYVESMREYAVFHTNSGKHIALLSLIKIEGILPAGDFIRIHRSYLVSKTFVKAHQKNLILLQDGSQLPMGRTYKQEVLPRLFE